VALIAEAEVHKAAAAEEAGVALDRGEVAHLERLPE
jgi:hypothetical protein